MKALIGAIVMLAAFFFVLILHALPFAIAIVLAAWMLRGCA